MSVNPATDKFRKLKAYTATTLSASINDSATTIAPSSVTGWPTDAPVTIVIDRVNANGVSTPDKREIITGAVSGSNLINCVRGQDGTSAQNHSAGATIEIVSTATDWNSLIEGILAGHAQDGSHTVDAISEKTEGAGVNIDSFKVKDGRPVGWDGWIAADETWAYASATTITVPNGAANKYAVGDRIRLVQAGSTKYFYVVGVADTTLTITAGTSFTLTTDTISNNFFSHDVSPVGFPHWFNYAPTHVGFSTAPTCMARFSIVGRSCTVLYSRITNGTSNGVGFEISMPVVSANIANMVWGGHRGLAVNNGAAVATEGTIRLLSNSTSATIWQTLTSAGWTNTGGKGADIEITYEI